MIEAVARAEAKPPEAVGERLKRLRLERGLSQRELASPGVSYAYISRIEAGTRTPSVKALRKLASKLDVSVVYLETGREIDESEERELRLADAELALRLGDADMAETELAQLFAEARAAGDAGVASRARVALALVADERGDHAAAITGFEEACSLERPSALDQVGVFVEIGRAYGALGAVDREIALYEECIEELARLGAERTSTMTRYQIRLSYALSDVGEFTRAEQVLQEALKDANADDRYMRIRIHWSLARLSEMEGRSRIALHHARRAIALLGETEDDLQRARAHLLAAWILNSAGNAGGAQAQLVQAERLLGEGAASDDIAILKVEKARAEALRGEADQAIALAREAIEILGDQHDATLGTAFWALGAGLALRGELDAANVAFEQSVELLESNRRWREATEVCRAWTSELRSAGRPEQALDVLERSQQFAAHLSERRQSKRSSSTRS